MKLDDVDKAVVLRNRLGELERRLKNVSQASIMELSLWTNGHGNLDAGIRLTVEHRDVLRALLKVHLEQCIADAVAELELL